ncbi:MAG: fasciclin domain-containing protein [Parvularculaceae bacterium]
MNIRNLLAAGAALSLFAAPAIAGSHGKDGYDKSAKADLVDTAVEAGSFTSLVAAVQAAGLEETLRGEGPFTVFAPTDEAFGALPAGTLDDLLKPENKEKLAGILTYHILSGKVPSKDIAGKTLSVDTVNGAKLNIDATDGVKVNGANVVTADVKASNGVIHVVDAVLLPPEDGGES